MSDPLDELKAVLLSEIQHLELNALKQSRHALTAKYREKREAVGKGRFMQSREERLAYVTTRMPATGAVIKRVLSEIKTWQPEVNFESLLDMGAGPGTALWAFACTYALSKATLIEQDADLINLGKRLASSSTSLNVKHADWRCSNLLQIEKVDPHEAVLFSYVLNELPAENQARLIQIAWEGALKNLILIEPGTPLGYGNILAARQQLISLGAHIIAPCPHAAACPLANSKTEWCHFSERLERSREHRFLKEGKLGYEDEKYSYLIASKQKGQPYSGRILNHPQKRSGHILLEVCTEEGAKDVTLSKKDGEAYKHAKKLDWGSALR
jgi:ribosomal protein RSM22 (predicted rRNA methylase)